MPFSRSWSATGLQRRNMMFLLSTRFIVRIDKKRWFCIVRVWCSAYCLGFVWNSSSIITWFSNTITTFNPHCIIKVLHNCHHGVLYIHHREYKTVCDFILSMRISFHSFIIIDSSYIQRFRNECGMVISLCNWKRYASYANYATWSVYVTKSITL